MKHNRKQKAAILLAAEFLSLLLAGCGGPKEGSETVAGHWEMTEISAGARQVAADEYKKAAGVSQVPALTFEETGEVTLDVDGDTGTGTWEQDGLYYYIKYTRDGEENTQAIKMEDGTMVIEQDGYTLTYEKH
ncbi:MAG: hypothetical protein HFE75_03180 [Firmicutes bacterium]|nr:hypothetical protein [Bacillota bacterium]